MLGLDVSRKDGGRGMDGTEQMITSCVQITGAWAGAVTLKCSLELARATAAAMFAAEPEDLGEDEVQDAYGELANMTGGNIKNLVEGTCHLSLPAVAQGVSYRLSIPGSVVRNQLDFTSDGQPLRVTVLERVE
jgi:chemotaxis protein CheX